MLGATLAARAGTAPPRPDSDIGFVEAVAFAGATVGTTVGDAPRLAQPAPPASIADQLAPNSGNVLVVAAMSSTTIPGTTRPRIAPAVAIR